MALGNWGSHTYRTLLLDSPLFFCDGVLYTRFFFLFLGVGGGSGAECGGIRQKEKRRMDVLLSLLLCDDFSAETLVGLVRC